MKLLDFLPFECVVDELKAENKEAALLELARIVARNKPSLDERQVYAILQEREKIGSTGIGHGVAIPHGKINNITSLIAVFARSKNGIDFDAIDREKVHFLCLLLAPEDSVGDHLKALARISRLFKKADFRFRLMKAQSKEEVWSVLREYDSAN